MKFLIKYGLLPVLFLMGFAMSSDKFRFGFPIDLTFTITVAFVFYYLFVYKKRIRGGLSYAWWMYLLVVPSIGMPILTGGNMRDMVYATLILVLPFALEPFVPGNDKQTIRGFYLTFIVSTIILLMYSNMGILSNWNTNCIAYLIYLGIAGAAVILSENRKNIIVWMLLVGVFLQLLVTQSRNVMAALVVVIVLVLFKKTVSKKWVYRVMYSVFLAYPVFFPALSLNASGTKLYNVLLEITTDVFDKNSVFSGRTELYEAAERLTSQYDLRSFLGFGEPMTDALPVHNDYYMVRYAYGIIGTLVIVGLLIAFFEKAYVLIKKDDNITFGCVVVTLGIIFQQASEGWFLASPLPVLMAFVYMAIVIKRYRMSEGKHLKNENL